ncbi:MAG: sigma factor, partial [Phenylobacterium sp.]
MAAGLAELSRRRRGSLVRYFLKRGFSSSDSEDAAQDIFHRLLQRRSADVVEEVDAYLFRTAANVAVDLRRRAAARGGDAHDPYDEAL